MKSNNPILLFDGICNLCNGAINFVLKSDRNKIFRYASLQSEPGKILIKKNNIPPKTDSVILFYKGSVYFESEAILKIAQLLRFPWSCAVVFKFIPIKQRNKLYKWVAKNRYRWFGKKAFCRIPPPEESQYFL